MRPRLLLPVLALLAPAAALAQDAVAYRTVEVRGAKMIPEEDIRETCGVEPGVPLSDWELRAIETCLMSTAVFDRVQLIPEGDRLVIAVDEVPQQPGRIEGNVSYISDSGLTVGFAYEQFNLIPDTFTALRFDIGREDHTLEAYLYRADAFGPDLDFGVDLVGIAADYDDQPYASHSLRIEPYVAWTPDGRWRTELGLGWRSNRQFDTEGDATAALRDEEGRTEAPYLRATLVWTLPRQDLPPALEARVDQYVWDLGTGAELSDTRLRVTGRRALGEKSELVLGLAGGAVAGLSGNAPRGVDRFHPGADEFRGFAARGLGPAAGGDLLGGDRYLVGSVELQRKLGTLDDTAFLGGVFFDIGSVWGLDADLGAGIDDGWRTRSSVGLSLTFTLGPTPISIFVAKPLAHEPQDDQQLIGLRISAAL